MEELKKILRYVSFGPFCKDFAGIDATKGIAHRMRGYNTAGKPADLTDQDKEDLKKGLQKFVDQANKVISNL